MQTQSIAEKVIYFCTFINDFFHYAWIYYLKTKDQQMEAFQQFKNLIEKQHNASIKILHTDQGGEYESKDFQKFLKDSRIIHKRTIPDTLQQNGLAERFNQMIVRSMKSMLHFTNFTYGFWVEAV